MNVSSRPPDASAVPRLLVIAECLPRPDESAGSRRFLTILAALARVWQVDLWVERDETMGETALAPDRVAVDRARLRDLGVHVLPTTWRALAEALRGTPCDAVWFEFYFMAERYLRAVRDWQPAAAVIVDSVDLHYARMLSGADLGTVPRSWALDVRRAELATYSEADVVVTASAADTERLVQDAGVIRVACVPVGVVARPRPTRARPPEALFVGHFRHAPNADGIGWFVREAWPRVRRRHPDARLTVVGSYATADIRALGRASGVNVVGYVPDVNEYLDRAATSIAPLRFGAGMKGKVVDALAAALPVVTTAVGAQGLELVSGRHALIADGADPFADAVIRIFDEPAWASGIGRAGQAHVLERCGPAAIDAALRAVMEACAGSARADAWRATGPGARWRLARLGVGHWLRTRDQRRSTPRAVRLDGPR